MVLLLVTETTGLLSPIEYYLSIIFNWVRINAFADNWLVSPLRFQRGFKLSQNNVWILNRIIVYVVS